MPGDLILKNERTVFRENGVGKSRSSTARCGWIRKPVSCMFQSNAPWL